MMDSGRSITSATQMTSYYFFWLTSECDCGAWLDLSGCAPVVDTKLPGRPLPEGLTGVLLAH